MNKKIKVNNKHNATITYYVCKSNADKPFGKDECERLFDDLTKFGKSCYHQCDTNSYRVRLFELDGYVYLTLAMIYSDNRNEERVSIQEFENKHYDDALKIAKYMKARIVEYDNNRVVA